MASFSVKVIPNAKTTAIVKTDPLTIRLHAPPREGKANRELIAFLADLLKCAPSLITIKSGASAKQKVLEIAHLETTVITQLLAKNQQQRLL